MDSLKIGLLCVYLSILLFGTRALYKLYFFWFFTITMKNNTDQKSLIAFKSRYQSHNHNLCSSKNKKLWNRKLVQVLLSGIHNSNVWRIQQKLSFIRPTTMLSFVTMPEGPFNNRSEKCF